MLRRPARLAHSCRQERPLAWCTGTEGCQTARAGLALVGLVVGRQGWTASWVSHAPRAAAAVCTLARQGLMPPPGAAHAAILLRTEGQLTRTPCCICTWLLWEKNAPISQ